MSRSPNDARPGRAAPAVAGTLAAVVALATTELAAGLVPGGKSLFVAVGDAVIEMTPGPVVTFAIETFGSANRLVLLTSMLLGIVVAGGFIGVWASKRSWIGPVALSVIAVLGMAAGLADPLVRPAAAMIGPIAGAGVGVAVLQRLLRLSSPQLATSAPATSPAVDREPSPTAAPAGSRRAFLGWAATAAGAAAMVAVGGRLLQQRSVPASAEGVAELPTPSNPLPEPSAGASLDVDGLSPLITPTEDFYRIDTAFTVPRVDADEHTVRFTGMVETPFEISYAELLDRADTEVDVTLACVSNEVGGRLVGNARWLGVPLSELLDQAGVHDTADQVVGRAVDGWTAGFPVEAAYDGRPAILAVGMNGEPLPPKHGFPVRLVVAGLYGYVSDTKWLNEVELTTFEAFDAYWVPRGWSQLGPIKTQSRIDVPRDGSRVSAGPLAIAGVAWAGERGIARVEVAVDDDWRSAELSDELSESSWRQWLYRWDAMPGDHVLRVRATDGNGVTQEAEVAPPQPDGATGYHAIRVTVT